MCMRDRRLTWDFSRLSVTKGVGGQTRLGNTGLKGVEQISLAEGHLGASEMLMFIGNLQEGSLRHGASQYSTGRKQL